MFGKRSRPEPGPGEAPVAGRIGASQRSLDPPEGAGRAPLAAAGPGAAITSPPITPVPNVIKLQASPSSGSNAIETRRSDSCYETKTTIFSALIEAIDLGQLSRLDAESAREEIRDMPSRAIREMICASVDVIIQVARLRDGSRRLTHITEVMGMEGDVIITQGLFVDEILGQDANGRIRGRHRSTGIGRPRFWERVRYFGEEQHLAAALDASEQPDELLKS